MAVATPIPVGPELDRAVAVAMGWMATVSPPDPFAAAPLTTWRHGERVAYSNRGGPVGYSTDPTTLAEMLAWLRTSLLAVRITSYATGIAVHDPIYAEIGCHQASGRTINEAVARLVLAVAAAKAAT